MFNIYDLKVQNPQNYRLFKSGESLIALYNCPLKSKFQDVWSHHNYIVYVVEGRKVWHTAHGSYELTPGSCVFVRKGASIIEQFFDGVFCVMIFFLPDQFICDVLKSKTIPLYQADKYYDPIISLNSDDQVKLYFYSMLSLFDSRIEPDPSLLEVKFRELVLTLAGDLANSELLAYFCSLLHEPQAVSLKRIMEENYCFNLGLEEFARLCNRSLSSFKRDFQKQFGMSPGKWLLEKRLDHAYNLLNNTDKTVTEAAFETGFESRPHFSRAFRERFGISPRNSKSSESPLLLGAV
jgi:AraC-like DNA-binding protein